MYIHNDSVAYFSSSVMAISDMFTLYFLCTMAQVNKEMYCRIHFNDALKFSFLCREDVIALCV